MSAEEAATLILEKLGVKLGEALTTKQLGSLEPKYRGGLTIAEVTPNGVVAKAGFRKGDILVGLGRHETLSLDNVVLVLRNLEVPPKGITTQSLRAFIIRNGETLTADLVLPLKAGADISRPSPSPRTSTDERSFDRSPSSSISVTKSFANQSLDELLAALRQERDPNQALSILFELSKKDFGDSAARTVEAVLAAMEFFDPSPPNLKPGQVPPSFMANELLTKIPRATKTPVFANVLRDGHSRSKLVAIWDINRDTSRWEYALEPDFPALAEQLLAIAASGDALPRAAAIQLLANTLPLTAIDLNDIVTESRREAIKRLGAA